MWRTIQADNERGQISATGRRLWFTATCSKRKPMTYTVQNLDKTAFPHSTVLEKKKFIKICLRFLSIILCCITLDHTQPRKLHSLKKNDEIFGNFSYEWLTILLNTNTMCITHTTNTLYDLCVYVYTKQSSDLLPTVSLTDSPWIQSYLKPNTKLTGNAYRNKSASSSAYYKVERATLDFRTKTLMLSLRAQFSYEWNLWVSHDDYAGYYLFGCDNMWLGGQVPVFCKKLLPVSSAQKNIPCRKRQRKNDQWYKGE